MTTFLNNNYNHFLRIRTETNTKTMYKTRFQELKNKIESNDNEFFSILIKKNCILDSNKNLPLLKRMEGGLGGDINTIHKQLRYEDSILNSFDTFTSNDIVLHILDSDIEKWTYDELDDIIHAFTKICNEYIHSDCVSGFIKLTNIKSDDSDDSDNDY